MRISGPSLITKLSTQFLNIPEDASGKTSQLLEVTWPLRLLAKEVEISVNDKDQPVDISSFASIQDLRKPAYDLSGKLIAIQNICRSLMNTISKTGTPLDKELKELRMLRQLTALHVYSEGSVKPSRHKLMQKDAEQAGRNLPVMVEGILIVDNQSRLAIQESAMEEVEKLEVTRLKVGEIRDRVLRL